MFGWFRKKQEIVLYKHWFILEMRLDGPNGEICQRGWSHKESWASSLELNLGKDPAEAITDQMKTVSTEGFCTNEGAWIPSHRIHSVRMVKSGKDEIKRFMY